MSVKINTLEFENVKRIKAVQLSPTKTGLTIIGGDNAQGKTSVLDSIAWALGGDKFKPSSPKREGSVIEPHLKVTLDNGITVERSGKNSALKVTDINGNKGGQQLLNSFIEAFALDLPKFMNQTSREKAQTLLRIIGVGDKLYELENKEKNLYDQRTAIGRIADQKDKFAKEMPVYTDVPAEPVSVTELIAQQQEILARNGENERLRQSKTALQARRNALNEKVEMLQKELARYTDELHIVMEQFETASKTVAELKDESTAELEESIRNIEEINKKILANLDREKAEKEAADYTAQYDLYTEQIEEVRRDKRALLEGADMPLEGLSVEQGELIYNGQQWDCMSGSEQLIVAASIVRKLNPSCGFVLLDKLEQMDMNTLAAFGAWLESQGLQAIATRVSKGDECSVIIEDGVSQTKQRTWKEGEF